ncbi:MAG: UDP-N-acetylglucosamine 2-epimerase (non-hydrolyzing) [Candidatus Cloacimonetes bacterium HGW-Cloacimonetes-1]|jgi:UDP-N-acetylglucosamine 2-epimerase|nr:MAG: UDP-N-acetylglucosamine 2-epimerase (non-hydrolyzing) [Candidatus Cloacimonetes bacterium HGW-Cloacimonetes-1]
MDKNTNCDRSSTKFLHVVGARPQFVKLAALSREIRKQYQEVIIHTGQHYDSNMSDSFFTDMDIPLPDYNLEAGSGSQAAQTARMLEGIEKVVLTEQPDMIVIYGDTNSTLAAALVGAKLQIPTAHVEACLRSFNRSMPEEINRIVADHTSDILLCPTQTAMHNASAEGLLAKSYLVGDVMVDSVAYGVSKAAQTSKILSTLDLKPGSFSLLTLHRPYNVDDPANLKHILDGLNSLGETVIFPVHPRTRKVITDRIQATWANILLIDPLSYLDFMMLHQNAKRMITDSGGVQKEAYLLHKPCITLRTETEWTETVESGWNLLLPPNSPTFPDQISTFLPPAAHPDLYGTDVSQGIVKLLIEKLQ